MNGKPYLIVVGGKQLRGLFKMLHAEEPAWLHDGEVYEIHDGEGIFQILFDENDEPVGSFKVSDEIRE